MSAGRQMGSSFSTHSLDVNYNWVNLNNQYNSSADLSPTDKIDGNIMISNDLNYNFGNINNKDWYMFSNFSLTYTFGRNPCYCNIGQ